MAHETKSPQHGISTPVAYPRALYPEIEPRETGGSPTAGAAEQTNLSSARSSVAHSAKGGTSASTGDVELQERPRTLQFVNVDVNGNSM